MPLLNHTLTPRHLPHNLLRLPISVPRRVPVGARGLHILDRLLLLLLARLRPGFAAGDCAYGVLLEDRLVMCLESAVDGETVVGEKEEQEEDEGERRQVEECVDVRLRRP